jgi:tetraacyldisaccharide 4'-kinase
MLLSSAGWLYGKIADIRNALYDRGVLRSHDLGAKTISIGNITTGGTGKTPLVAHVAEILADAGEKVCILTRGYGRKNERERVLVSDWVNVLADTRTGGDEPVELAGKLIGKAIVVADADRVAAAEWAKENFGITAFVLDDGFQHRRAKRDLDIVCIDATNPFGKGTSLSRGILREPLSNLSRADVIIITRAELADDLDQLRSKILRLSPASRIFVSRSELADADSGSSVGLLDIGLSAFAFCGIGNPEAFFASVRRRGYEIKGTRVFPDHHYYTQQEFRELKREAHESGASLLLTTWKDNVKLTELPLTSDAEEFGMLCYAATLVTTIEDVKEFRDLIISS